MILQIKDIFDIASSSRDFSYVIPVNELAEYKGYTFISPIAINGTLVNRAGIVTLSYNVGCSMKHICDRCLSEFTRDYSYNFSATLVRSVNQGNDEYIVCGDNTLDMDELAISDLLLQLESKTLCTEDCKGLCMKCGKNLNEGDCSCIKE